MKVLTVFGTRPGAIKMAPIIKELEKYPDEIKSVVCATAQHREMLDQVLELFELVVGNTVIDALQMVVSRARRRVRDEWEPWLKGRRLLLVTAHRRENFGRPLVDICHALAQMAREYAPDVHILYPVHLNPKVWEPVHATLGGVPNITLTPPLDYETFVGLMDRAYLVLTDSGGLQEEAPGLGKPVLVLREVTERPEGVAAGTIKVVGTSCQRIVEETAILLEDGEAYERMARAVNPYGDGRASQRIVAALLGRPVESFVGTAQVAARAEAGVCSKPIEDG